MTPRLKVLMLHIDPLLYIHVVTIGETRWDCAQCAGPFRDSNKAQCWEGAKSQHLFRARIGHHNTPGMLHDRMRT